MTIKEIEDTWRQNFKKSPLITGGVFDALIARQLYYGPDEESDLPFKKGFRDFNDNFDFSEAEHNLDELLEYLHFIGITISKKTITESIAKGATSYQNILKRAFYIFKHLAGYHEDHDVNDPYHENMGDLLFFLRIEEGDNKQAKQLTLFDEQELPDFYNKYIELPTGYENDKIAKKLFELIENSNKSIFLTGKAGTGKSTFVHYFTKKTKKNVLLVAFTGIAAINIGGQTIHSFFRFPLKPLLPNDPEIPIFKPFSQKRKILEQTDTIIIDEVSMLRADILEGLDYSLRINGGNRSKFFGGKQLILVGDIFQLPPVIDNSDEVESELFKSIYDSEYFFDSLAYRQLNPENYEFTKVHRQSDEHFINLLNRVRDCSIDNNGIDELNERYDPNYVLAPEEFVITLTSNNYLAKSENIAKLNLLPYKSHFFKANIVGDFKEDKYPTDLILALRRDSQIILVKNDSLDKGRRWVNGTIAKIEFCADEKIEIRLKDGSVHNLEKETWENRRYEWDKNKGCIKSKIIGTFEQYPIKLAWAITIHKSQGLTFDNVIIDLGSGAFVNGQLYTALSRCKSLEGLKLKRKIRKEDIIEDKRIIDFCHNQIERKSIVIQENDFRHLFEINDWILLRLICMYYSFSPADIIKYHSILKWGSGVYTWRESDPYFQQYSFAKYGLSFNRNIDWSDDRVLNASRFEANSYQLTGFDQNELPLSIEAEKEIRLSFISEKLVFEPDIYVINTNDEPLSEESINEQLDREYSYHEKKIIYYKDTLESLEKDFDFYTINELIAYVHQCQPIVCLNERLYENMMQLLGNSNINVIDMIDELVNIPH